MSKHIIIDTREKPHAIQHIKNHFDAVGITYEIAKLDYGDYMDLNCAGIVIDRKQNIAELAKNVTTDRARFIRELERAKAAQAQMVILVEQNYYKDGLKWRHVTKPIDLISWQSKYTKIKGEKVYRALQDLIYWQGIQIQFCEKRQTGAEILRILYGMEGEQI